MFNPFFLIHSIESEDVQNIVKSVRQILDRKGQFASEGLIGVRSQVRDLITMLQIRKQKPKDVVVLGVWGMAGIGKTTLARLIFEHVQYRFERTCFLSNVSEAWLTKGKANLQKELRSLICDEIGFIKFVLEVSQLQKVFLVLDDVNNLEQLHALCGTLGWFGEGSRIIITTRDLHLLKAFKVDLVYSVKYLSADESLQLFSRITLKQPTTKYKGGFEELCRRVVAYSEGLPLALKFFGTFLARKSLVEWESALMKLFTVLPPQIYNTLKLALTLWMVTKKEYF